MKNLLKNLSYIYDTRLWRVPTVPQMTWKYHKQYRLPTFDYSSNNIYYITVCTKDQQHFFGEIVDNEMVYSGIGLQLREILKAIPENLDYLKIHGIAILPNHLHFLAEIFIEDNQYKMPQRGLHPLVPKSISSVTNHLKGKLKRWCNDNSFSNFQWQARFHDRIIRNHQEFKAKIDEMENNVSMWSDDPENDLFRKR